MAPSLIRSFPRSKLGGTTTFPPPESAFGGVPGAVGHTSVLCHFEFWDVVLQVINVNTMGVTHPLADAQVAQPGPSSKAKLQHS